MKEISRDTIYKGNFINQKEIKYIRPDGEIGKWEMVSRSGVGNAVSALIENTTNDTFILVEQYRIPVKSRVLELVAGICDKPGFTNEQIIREEIIEETGYVADSVEFIMSGPNSAGLTDEINSSYFAKVSGERGQQQLEGSEEIEVIEFPKSDINKLIESKTKQGILISPQISAILYNLLTSGKISIK